MHPAQEPRWQTRQGRSHPATHPAMTFPCWTLAKHAAGTELVARRPGHTRRHRAQIRASASNLQARLQVRRLSVPLASASCEHRDPVGERTAGAPGPPATGPAFSRQRRRAPPPVPTAAPHQPASGINGASARTWPSPGFIPTLTAGPANRMRALRPVPASPAGATVVYEFCGKGLWLVNGSGRSRRRHQPTGKLNAPVCQH